MVEKTRKRINFSYWILFIVSMVSLSQFFGAYKLLRSPALFTQASLTIGLSFGVFMLSLFFLGFIIYAEEKDAQNLRTNFSPYDFLYKKIWVRSVTHG